MIPPRDRLPPDPDGLPVPEERPGFEAPEATIELQPAASSAPLSRVRPGRVHLVVVVTRAVSREDRVVDGAVLVARYWHPSLHRWSEHSFESLEHAMHLFIDESGWVLRQQQALEGSHAHELIFEARREDFSRPSTEAILQDVGLTPEDVADLLGRMEREDGA